MKNKLLIFILFLLTNACKWNTPAMNNQLHNMPYEEMHALAQRLSEELNNTPQKGFESFQYYYAHGDTPVKSYLMATLKRTTLESDNFALRQQTAGFLLNVATRETEIQLHNEALDGLLKHSENDFSPRTKTILAKIDISQSPELIKITGVANIKSREEELKNIATISRVPQIKRASIMALARMGDKQNLNEVIQMVKSESDIVQRIYLFDDLAWTRQQEAFSILRNYLHSQERLPDTRDHSIPGTPEAAYAARAFINHIKNCPVKSVFPNAEELPIIVNWADQQKKWLIK